MLSLFAADRGSSVLSRAQNSIPGRLVRILLLVSALFLWIGGLPCSICAQSTAGGLDLTFDPGIGPDGKVVTIAIQVDGRILIGGGFSSVQNQPRPGIARLNSDGMLDISFTPAGVGTNVSALVLQPDGRVLAGSGLPGAAMPDVIRLNSDGTLDPSFAFSARSKLDSVDQVALTSTGKVMVRSLSSAILRLNSGGDEDVTFAPLFARSVFGPALLGSMGVQSDGKVVYFLVQEPPDLPTLNLGRLNLDGSGDGTFQIQLASGTETQTAILVESDDHILIAADFAVVQNTMRSRIARLNPDGTLDSRFDPGLGPNGNPVLLAEANDGKILVAGTFTQFNTRPRVGLARLNEDGSVDETFVPAAADGPLTSVAVQANGDVIIGGDFGSVAGVSRHRVARLTGGVVPGPPSIAVQPASQNVVLGEPVRFVVETASGSSRPRYQWQFNGADLIGATNNVLEKAAARFDHAGQYWAVLTNASGSRTSAVATLTVIWPLVPPASFDAGPFPAPSPDGPVTAVLFEADGSVDLAGAFQRLGGMPRPGLARLTPSGTVDTTFVPHVPVSNGRAVERMVRDAEGRFILSTSEPHVRQVLPDGSSGFDVPIRGGPVFFGPNGYVSDGTSIESLAPTPDGKVLIGGAFTYVNAVARNRIARLNPNGTVDQGFNLGAGPSGGFINPNVSADTASVTAIALQPDGKILIGGTFTQVSGVDRWKMARLLPGGSLDPTFNPPHFASDAVSTNPLLSYFHVVLVQPDGQILVAGEFTRVDAATPIKRNRIARLSRDGKLDLTFDPRGGANGAIDAVVPLPAGKFLIGGDFTNYGNSPRARLARINPDGSLDPTFDPGPGADGRVLCLASAPDGRFGIGGSFSNVDALPLPYFALLYPYELLSPTWSPNGFSTRVLTAPGRVYRLEFSSSLNPPEWLPVATFQGDGSPHELRHTPSNGATGFYRVRIEPLSSG